MEFSSALAADLDLLTDALNDPDIDIATTLRLLGRDASAALEAYSGLSLTIGNGESMMSFTAMERGAESYPVASSILLPLLRTYGADAEPRATLILYATRAGAFVDLAADLAWLTGADPGDFALDQHIAVQGAPRSLDSLREASAINQAVGVLIGQGFTPSAAGLELAAQAAAAGTTRYVVADLMLTFSEILPPDADLDPV